MELSSGSKFGPLKRASHSFEILCAQQCAMSWSPELHGRLIDGCEVGLSLVDSGDDYWTMRYDGASTF
jgi:hypothetical protein